jgi:hypothetical protein
VTFDVKWATRPVERKIQKIGLEIENQQTLDYHSLAINSYARLDVKDD